MNFRFMQSGKYSVLNIWFESLSLLNLVNADIFQESSTIILLYLRKLIRPYSVTKFMSKESNLINPFLSLTEVTWQQHWCWAGLQAMIASICSLPGFLTGEQSSFYFYPRPCLGRASDQRLFASSWKRASVQSAVWVESFRHCPSPAALLGVDLGCRGCVP